MQYFTKPTAREWAKKQRNSLTSMEVYGLSTRIFRQLATHWTLATWQHVHVFLPIEAKKEVDTWQFIEQIRRINPYVCLYVPRMSSDAHMTHHLLTDSTRLVTNAWGITEPAEESIGLSTEAFWATVTNPIILVPLLYIDTNGYRVGYGKGFYDRFLATDKPHTRIGLNFFEPCDTLLEVNAFDIPVQFCATPHKIWTF